MTSFPQEIAVSVHHDFMHGRIVVLCHDRHGFYTIADGVMKRTPAEAGTKMDPLFSCHGTDFLRAFADALADFGIMPKTGDNAKELSATKAHLEDMRKMALKAFDVAIVRPVVTEKITENE